MILRYDATGASSRVRGIEPAARMRRRVSILTPDQKHWRRRYYAAALSPRALYLQKRSSPRDLQIARLRRRLRFSTVYDTDDAPGGIHESRDLEDRTAGIMAAVHAVTVGSRALEEFAARHARVVEWIPSAVDTGVYSPAPPADPAGRPPVVGWIGNGAGYLPELSDLASVLGRVRARMRVRARIVGAMGRGEIHTLFDHEDDTVIDAIDWRNEAAIADAVRGFDIGVYPLRDTGYNAFKCGYKAIQYMATGLAVVASPTGENARIVDDGATGFLPQSEDEWADRVCALAADPAARERMGAAGRRVAVERYSLERAASKLDAVLDRIGAR